VSATALSTGRDDAPQALPRADGRSVPFGNRATIKDIFYCFRLLLGRFPHPEEWRGHAMRAGEDLAGVVASFAGSLECSRRGLVAAAGGASGGAVLSSIEGFSIYSMPDDASVGSAVRAGSYEPEVAAQFHRLLRPGMRVLDLGANIGFFALLAARLVGPTGQVIAVEPNPRNARLLEASRRSNGFEHLVVMQLAAGRANGLLVLNTSYSNGTTAELSGRIESVLQAQTVPCVRIDQILPEDGPVNLVKIDVEGAEFAALQGCEAMLRRDRPVIISEFSPGLLPGISGIDGRGYLGWLTGLGYDLSVILPDGSLFATGTAIEPVMRLYAERQSDHIDILGEPRAQAAAAP